LEAADLELLSHPLWKAWCRSLPPTDAQALKVWRGGAVFTPTRRWIRRNDSLSHCPWCPAERASARHFFAECPRLAGRRSELEASYGIAPEWWGAQARAVSKTGWLPLGSTVQQMIAANALGVAIAQLADEMRASWTP
jgi:hypothetical protein